jgi:hypothetical protein
VSIVIIVLDKILFGSLNNICSFPSQYSLGHIHLYGWGWAILAVLSLVILFWWLISRNIINDRIVKDSHSDKEGKQQDTFQD